MTRKNGGEYISVLRWLDATTLLVQRTTASRYGPNIEKLWRLTCEITLHFDKEGRASVKAIRKLKVENL